MLPSTFAIVFVLYCSIASNVAVRRCIFESYLKYHKVKHCHRSLLPMIAWKSARTVKECIKFSREKKGMAFNYSPLEVQNSTGVFIFQNCQVIGCPELFNSTTLVSDPSFDYFSAFGNHNSMYGLPILNCDPQYCGNVVATEDSICIKNLGLYKIIEDNLNYTDAIQYCQNLGADLANILTESRTNLLGSELKTLKGSYKAAYVGLDDMSTEGFYETPIGNFLSCTKYRAWSPGHPRRMRQKDDCVILDSERMWRSINCKIKMPFICEYYSEAPIDDTFITHKNCAILKNKRKKQQCYEDEELFKIYNSSSRFDQCALMDD